MNTEQKHDAAPAPRLPALGWIHSRGFKIVGIGTLVLALLIPLGMLRGLANDRQDQADTAERTTAESWGGPARITGPLLRIPVDHEIRSAEGRISQTRTWVHFMGSTATWQGTVDTEIRYRGIFPVPLYTLDLRQTVDFRRPAADDPAWDPGHPTASSTIRWDQAQVVIPVPSFAALRDQPRGSLGDEAVAGPLEGQFMDGLGEVFTVTTDPRAWDQGAETLSIAWSVRGISELRLIPRARQANISLEADWAGPEFFGQTLPDERTLGDDGFSARWMVNGWQSTWTQDHAEEAAAGIRLHQSLNVYTLTHRALAYGILVLILPFVALFLWELLAGLNVHPVQYALVGATNVMFFLLLLSLSEHWGFGLAYLAASMAVGGILTWYGTVLAPGKPAMWAQFGLLTAGLYGYLYLALTSEDYALLTGSLGLLVILVTVMVLTRKVRWYQAPV